MIKLIKGDMLIELDKLDENSVDSIVTDPPYELNFMNKGWDNAGVSFNKETWQKCLRVLKPGGYLLAFGGSRTFHRIACAIEDAGFEIRDTIMWLYGSGFPKSMDISKQIDKRAGAEREVIGKGKAGLTKGTIANFSGTTEFDITIPATDLAKQWEGWGTSLKPAFEPIIMARKPVEKTVINNVEKYGVGGINIDECRVGETGGVKKINIEPNSGSKNSGFGCNGDLEELNKGRFPANTILTYDDTDYDEVCGGFPETKSIRGARGGARNKNGDIYGEWKKNIELNYECRYNDSGNACRYFYCAKASKKDRDEGLDDFENGNITDGRKNIHPTVKPTELMQYLIRLVTPEGGLILDPFMGSGSTGKAAIYENIERNKNYSFIGIEKEENYIDIAKARIEYVYKKVKKDE